MENEGVGVRSHYDVLGVSRDADTAAIRAAYRRLAQKVHPDRPGGSHEKFVELQRAFDILSNPGLRTSYDATGKAEDVTLKDAEDSIRAEFGRLMEERSELEDLVAIMRQRMWSARAKNRGEIERLERVIARQRRALSRVRYRGHGKNLLREVLERRIADAEGGIDTLTRDEALADLVLALLADFDYALGPTMLGFQKADATA